MNLNNNPIPDQLRELLARQDDNAGHHVLWVAPNGDVTVTILPRGLPAVDFHPVSGDVRLRYETFLAGNGYVGPEAAADDEWVSELFDRLVTEWRRVKETSELELIPID